MAVIKSHHAETLRPRRPVGLHQFARINLKPIARRIVPRIRRRNRAGDKNTLPQPLPQRERGFIADQEAAALMRVILGSVSAYGSVLVSC